MGFTLAVIGATGTVGREILQILDQREFGAETVHAVDTDAAIGKEVSYGEDRLLKVQGITNFDFDGVDIVLFAGDADMSEKFAPKAADAGAVVIDAMAPFRMAPDVPLVAANVNDAHLDSLRNRNIVASPNPSVVQVATVLRFLQDLAPIKRVVLSTYQATSSAGRAGMDELFSQTRNIYVNQPIEKHVFQKQIAFNCIPHIGDFLEDGSTQDEAEIVSELKKVLDPSIEVAATCVMVPVFVGHAISVNVEFHQPLDLETAREALRDTDAVSVVDHHHEEGFVTQDEVAGEDAVYVSRMREDTSVPYGLSFWTVADNVRGTRALNMVQIAEKVANGYL